MRETESVTGSARENALAADLASGRFVHVVVDFDNTLFLDNSTERFLDALRPRLVAFLLVACSDWIVRALAWFGLCRFNDQRDFARVTACTVLMPWSGWLWRREAKRLARQSMNSFLLERLPPDAPPLVLSYGFRPILRPLLKEAGLERAVLIASDILPRPFNLRSRGKLEALKRHLPRDEWDKALFVTDSTDDAAIMQAIPRSHLIQWGAPGAPAFRGLYLPLRYTVEGKYANSRYFTCQILMEDLVLLLFAYSFSLPHAAALWWLFLSLYAIYEIGYYDNDHVAPAFEEKPVVSEAARTFPVHPRIRPWVWALFLAAAGIACARPEYALHPVIMAKAWMVDLACWGVLLSGACLTFWFFNRREPARRVALFPVLHIYKTFSFAMFVPLTLAGTLLLTAQVFSISANYWLYRRGGVPGRFNRQAWRTLIFLALAVLVSMPFPGALTGAGPVWWSLVLVWGAVRSLEHARHKNILRILAETFRPDPRSQI